MINLSAQVRFETGIVLSRLCCLWSLSSFEWVSCHLVFILFNLMRAHRWISLSYLHVFELNCHFEFVNLFVPNLCHIIDLFEYVWALRTSLSGHSGGELIHSCRRNCHSLTLLNILRHSHNIANLIDHLSSLSSHSVFLLGRLLHFTLAPTSRLCSLLVLAVDKLRLLLFHTLLNLYQLWVGRTVIIRS